MVGTEMVNTVFYIIISVIIVSLVSLVGIISLIFTKKKLSNLLLILVSLSAGTLLGGAFLHLLPEAIESSGFTITVSLLVLAGIIVFFIIERFIHFHQCEVPHTHEFPLVHDEHQHEP